MANILFDTGREGILDRTIDMTSDIRVMLVPSTYSFVASHKFVTDLAVTDNGRSASLTGMTYTSGAFDANDTTLLASAAVACNALIVYDYSGDDSTSRLVAYIDTPTAGLPMTPAAGQTVNIAFDQTANKIFKL